MGTDRCQEKHKVNLGSCDLLPCPHRVVDGATPQGDQQTSGTKRMAARFKTRPLRPGTPWSSPTHDLTGPQEADAGTYAPPPR